MAYQPIYRWGGRYFGFITRGRLFDRNSNYVGWIENDGSVWHGRDGRLLGQVTQGNYILKNSMRIDPIPRIPRIPPIPPIPPIPRLDRIGKIGKIGWEDALDEFGN